MRAQIYYNFLFVNAFIACKLINLHVPSKAVYVSTFAFCDIGFGSYLMF